jgi:hypothetical protein
MIRKTLISLLAILAILPGTNSAHASQAASQWYFGNWNDCKIDGRPAKMQWKVVDDSQTQCDGNICQSTSGNWVPLSVRYNRTNEVGIRYLGREQDNWVLRYNPNSRVATGYTTWRGNRYPLSCRR